jgi:hypothetical protein
MVSTGVWLRLDISSPLYRAGSTAQPRFSLQDQARLTFRSVVADTCWASWVSGVSRGGRSGGCCFDSKFLRKSRSWEFCKLTQQGAR